MFIYVRSARYDLTGGPNKDDKILQFCVISVSFFMFL